MDLTGRMLAQYRVAGEISRGGMGVVYRAIDTRLNREVALKVLPDDLVDDAERRHRFVQEAQAASAIEHPNIAVIYDVNEADGHTFIAMELIRGEKMSEWLAHGRPNVAKALEVAIDVAAGLAKAHERQVVHRDLKPANVMVTDEGHAKVIDFGIAKLIEPTVDGGLPTRTSYDTGMGVVLGTMTYMSPEQARGERVDHRSDVFSFGIVLHEMLAGRPPFAGKSSIETASAILHEPAPRLPDLGPGIVPDAGADIQRVLDKCLAKDPAERYQSMKDVVVDLRATRRRLETGAHSGPVTAVVTPTPRRPRWQLAVAVIAALLVAAASAWIGLSRRDRATIAADSGSSRPSVAVLYFDNTTGDQSLDWMRTGIAEMVVTDLSQSQRFDVIGTEHLYGILAEMKRADDQVLAPDVIRAVAERTGVDSVIVGSFMRAGDALRINVRLQDAKSGRIVTSERVDGPDATNLFAMVDDVARRIRGRVEQGRAGEGPLGSLLTQPRAAADAPLDRGLTDITTSSIEAYRLFAEGMNLHLRFREREAIPYFEKAVAVDPGFAVAYGRLAVIHGNLGRLDLRLKYLDLALQHVDRLTPRERLYLEGHYYSRPESVERAVDSYQRCIELYPADESCRHNLAFIQAGLGRLEESSQHYEELIRRGSTFPATFANLAQNYRELDQSEKALETAQRYSTRNPESGAGHGMVGTALLGLCRYRDAAEAFARALQLDPTSAFAPYGQAAALMLEEDWAGARRAATAAVSGASQEHRWFGAVAMAQISLYAGRPSEARPWAERAVAVYEQVVPRKIMARMLRADVDLAAGRLAAAAATAEQALVESGNRAREQVGPLLARYRARTGRRADAEALLAELAGTASSLRSVTVGRAVAFGRGAVAQVAGDNPTAIRELMAAHASLSIHPRGHATPAQHVPIWFALGEAHLGVGRAAEARGWFERIAKNPADAIWSPVEYVRSLYFLGTIEEATGNTNLAREYYGRFLAYWGEGEIDRDKVETARHKLRAAS
jgi:tetratricopeptide (TPR) repeat protein/TolB-like protein/predicted Ser/Thr protein kinase